MSHFTRIQTRLAAREHLMKALQDLGHVAREGRLEIRGFQGIRTTVDIMIPTGTAGYDIGFQKVGDCYEMVADWWGLDTLDQEQFLQQLTRAYAYNAVRAQLDQQGFSLVEEEQTAEQGIRLTLRRVV